MNIAFQPFLSLCNKYLDTLLVDRGFQKLEPVFLPPECSLRYTYGDLTIEVIYEYDDYPWIRVATRNDKKSLDSIIRMQYKQFEIDRKKKRNTEDKIRVSLESYRDALMAGIMDSLLE